MIEKPKPEELDIPIQKPSEKTALPELPEREWLYGIIQGATLRYKTYMGAIDVVKDQEGKPILKDGEPIKKKEFNICFDLYGHTLPDGSPRKVWLSMTVSLGLKAKLPVFLDNMNISLTNPSPRAIIDTLINTQVKLQITNRKKLSGEGSYPVVIFDAVLPSGPANDSKLKEQDPEVSSIMEEIDGEVINPKDIKWEE